MEITIQEIKSRKDLADFIHFPHILYKDHPCWVPPLTMSEFDLLRRDKNPAFDHCQARYWLARDESGRMVGRVAGIINRLFIQKWGQAYARFGWFDFVDDARVSKALLQAVEDWAAQNGMTAVHGPMGFTDLDKEGMLVEGFDELGGMVTLYNYPYYPRHMEQLGYVKDVDWVEFEFTLPAERNQTISRVAELAAKRSKLSVRCPRNQRELAHFAKDILRLINEEYSHLYGVVPLTPRQEQFYIQQYLAFGNPALIPFVFDEQQHVVGFAIGLSSLSKALQKARGNLFPFGFIHLLNGLRGHDVLEMHLGAVQADYHGRGANLMLIDRMSDELYRKGFKTVRVSPQLEANTAVQAMWKPFNPRTHKRRRVYIKHLASNPQA